MRITAIGFLYTPLITPQNVILRRKLDFKTQTKISLTTRFFGAIAGIVLAYTGYGLWALVLSNFFSGILALILNWVAVRWLPKVK